jgi:tryptophan synthase beta subunit
MDPDFERELAQTLRDFAGRPTPLIAAPRLSEECRRGLQAFFAKQPPPWA